MIQGALNVKRYDVGVCMQLDVLLISSGYVQSHISWNFKDIHHFQQIFSLGIYIHWQAVCFITASLGHFGGIF